MLLLDHGFTKFLFVIGWIPCIRESIMAKDVALQSSSCHCSQKAGKKEEVTKDDAL